MAVDVVVVEGKDAPGVFKFHYTLDDNAKAASFGILGNENRIPQAAAEQLKAAFAESGYNAILMQEDRERYIGGVELPGASHEQAMEVVVQVWDKMSRNVQGRGPHEDLHQDVKAQPTVYEVYEDITAEQQRDEDAQLLDKVTDWVPWILARQQSKPVVGEATARIAQQAQSKNVGHSF